LDEIGFVWSKKGDNLKALDYFNKSLLIREKNLGSGHLDCANSYRNLGLVCESKGDMENAWKYFNKCLEIEVKFLGEMHPSTAATLDNIGKILSIEHQLDKALEFYQKSLNIRLKTLGNFHSQVEKSYYNIGSVLYKKCCYQEALYYYNKSLEINLSRRKDILFIEYLYFDIGLCHKNIKDFSSAINSLISGYKLSRRGGFPYHIAECYEALNDKESAFQYFLESAEIRKDSIGKEHESTQNSIDSAKRLAKALGKEGELPEWMN
jgi:tetratricopeptide (TPR) repeat protein